MNEENKPLISDLEIRKAADMYGKGYGSNNDVLSFIDGARWMRRIWETKVSEQSMHNGLKYDGKKLIGKSRERHKELKHKNWDWRSFYNGWIEGRVDMIQEIKNNL